MDEEKEVKISKIRKRDGRIVDFDKNKITEAIWKAAKSVGGKDRQLSEKLANQVVELLEKQLKPGEIPTVEQVQDLVEKVLVENGHYKTAKAYILYRKERTLIREEKKRILQKEVIDEIDKKFSLNAIQILASRYLQKNEEGKLIESPKQLFQRVAALIVIPDILHDEKIFDKEGKQEIKEVENFKAEEYEGKLGLGDVKWNRWHLERMKNLYDELNSQGKMKVSWSELLKMIEKGEFENYYQNYLDYFNLMIEKKFLPNSPTLFNAGTRLSQLSACFVLNIDDSMQSIMEAAKDAALIFQSGGGIGINFSKIRPEGDIVTSTGGIASGPISFARIIDVITDVVKQGGKRRGACMGILEISHPDIEKFITVKETPGMFENFNLSVLIFPDFIEAYYKDENYPLINPRNKKVWKYVKAKYLMDAIAMSAWRTGDPGVIFFDNLNKRNVLIKAKGPIRATNPCVTGDTYVVTDYGLVEAKELKKGMKVLTLDGWCKIDEVIDNGIKPVIEIKLQNGIEIKVTEDHKILTENGWKQAKELKKGEKLKIMMDYPQFSKADFDYPEEMAEFLGFWCSDSLSFSDHVTLSPGKDELAREITSSISGNSCLICDGDQLKLDICPKNFAEFIRKCFGLKSSSSENKLVPKLILQAPKNFQKAFLRGIFSSDGSVYDAKNSVTISLSSSSKKFLQQIQLMLLGFGILSTLTKEKRQERKEIKGKTYGTWRLLINSWGAKKFVEEIGLRGKKLKKFLKLTAKKKFYNTQEDLEFVPIKSIRKCGKERVFDVRAPPAFCWITNGLYSKDCGEEPLYEYESCNLGSINLYAHFKEDENGNKVFDWNELKRSIEIATQFLDNVIDMNKFPIEKIEKTTKASRKIGLGVMGLADTLFAMKLPYNSEEGFEMMRKIMEFITFNAMLKSCKLARERGVFPLYSQSSYPNELPIEGFYEKEIWTQDWNKVVEEIKRNGIRNAEVTTLAPTGSLSMLCDVSSGIEPQYALVFEKVVTIGSFYYTDLEFENQLRSAGLYEDEILKKIKENGGSVQGLKEIPEEIRKVFVTALDIPWWDHVRAQAEIGKWVCAATSKTINMPNWVVPEDVKNAFLFAYKLGCKGITIYRDGSKTKQVLYSPPAEVRNRQKEVIKLIKNKTLEMMKKFGIEVPEFWGFEEETPKTIKKIEKDRCPECGSQRLVEESGCLKCLDCGWGVCTIA
jgi:ribonucleoside-diphosphate reductase alpha chain